MPIVIPIFAVSMAITMALKATLHPKKDDSGPGFRCWIGFHPYRPWKQEQGKSWSTTFNPIYGVVDSGWILVKRRECRHCGNIQRKAIGN